MKKAFTGAARGYWDCEMHEMMKGRSQCGTAVTQAKSKSDQIKSVQRVQTRDGSCRRDADSGGRDARAPRRMGCPHAQGQSASIKINQAWHKPN